MPLADAPDGISPQRRRDAENDEHLLLDVRHADCLPLRLCVSAVNAGRLSGEECD
jgi:hypothetical protein